MIVHVCGHVSRHALLKVNVSGADRVTTCVCTSVLQLLGPVVGAVLPLHAEVDVGTNAAVVERLHRADVVAHAKEDLRRLVLAQQAQGVHLR